MVQTSIGPGALIRERRVSVLRIVGGGGAAAALVLLIGAAIELARFGSSDAVAAGRVEQDVRAAFAAMTADVERLAHMVARDPSVAEAMASGLETDTGVRTLFDTAARARGQLPESFPLVAITIYDTLGGARGWAGRASDLPRERPVTSPIFVAPSPLGLRLVHLEPIVAATPDRSRLGSVAVEHVLTPVRAGSLLLTSAEYMMPTRRARVQLRLHDPARSAQAPVFGFVVAAPDRTPLVDVSIPPGELAAGRSQLRRTVSALALALLAVTVLLLAGPLLDARLAARAPWRELRLTAAILAVILGGAGLLWLAFRISPWFEFNGHRGAAAVLLGGATAAALAATLVSAAVRLRVALRAIRHRPDRKLDAVHRRAAGLWCAPRRAADHVRARSWDGASIRPRSISAISHCIPGVRPDSRR